jgi:hypothetical protein
MVKTFPNLTTCLMEYLQLVFRLLNTLVPSTEESLLLEAITQSLCGRRLACKLSQALRHDIGKPPALTLYYRNNDVVLVVTLDVFTDLEKVTLNRAFNTRRCIDEAIECATHLHAYLSL